MILARVDSQVLNVSVLPAVYKARGPDQHHLGTC